MGRIINLFVVLMAKFHDKILSIFGGTLSDKWLHFLFIGLIGFAMLMIVQPLFKWLASHDGTILITFIYVFTLILVLTFAIEIGQWYSHTGDMDFYDIASGVAGFFVFFGIYLVFYLVYRNIKDKDENSSDSREIDEKKTKK